MLEGQQPAHGGGTFVGPAGVGATSSALNLNPVVPQGRIVASGTRRREVRLARVDRLDHPDPSMDEVDEVVQLLVLELSELEPDHDDCVNLAPGAHPLEEVVALNSRR
ncbi:MAG: hypothetical protein ABJA74_00950 [Lapillicoccus sp.]